MNLFAVFADRVATVLASLQAANGMIIFGWSTALIFWYLQQIYEERQVHS